MVSNNTGQLGGGQTFGPSRTFSGIGFLLEQWETNEVLSGMASQDRIYILNGSSGCRGQMHWKLVTVVVTRILNMCLAVCSAFCMSSVVKSSQQTFEAGETPSMPFTGESTEAQSGAVTS